jgi:hypothetical protein
MALMGGLIYTLFMIFIIEVLVLVIPFARDNKIMSSASAAQTVTLTLFGMP